MPKSDADMIPVGGTGWTDDGRLSAVLVAVSAVFAASPFVVALFDDEFAPYAFGISAIFVSTMALGLLSWACDRHERATLGPTPDGRSAS